MANLYSEMRIPCLYILTVIFLTNAAGIRTVEADELSIPLMSKPGTMVHLSPAFNPPILKGIKVHPENPFRFDFILDRGDSLPLVGRVREGDLKQESTKLIKYFLASLTIPEQDLWVNLSPYEKNRIVPEAFGQTVMGRDLLAQDYMLKQITASLIYPEDKIGKEFWKRVYEEAAKKFGTTNIPVNTFNKVWIVPEKAVVYEFASTKGGYVVESKLKVMLEEDYLSLTKNTVGAVINRLNDRAIDNRPYKDVNKIGSQIVREIIIPQLTKEINTGKNFAQLRQVYNSLILATWYKKKIKDSILSQVYSNQNKIIGVRYNEKHQPNGRDQPSAEKIYERYLQAFKRGAYNYIKEDQDPLTRQMTPRKYFSGGVSINRIRNVLKTNSAMSSTTTQNGGNVLKLEVEINPEKSQNNISAKGMGKGLYVIFTNEFFRQQIGEVIRIMALKGHVSEFQVNMNGESSPIFEGDGVEFGIKRPPLRQGEFIHIHSHPFPKSPFPSKGDFDFWKQRQFKYGIIILGYVGQGFVAFVYDIHKINQDTIGRLIQAWNEEEASDRFWNQNFWLKEMQNLINNEVLQIYRLMPHIPSVTHEGFNYFLNNENLPYSFEQAGTSITMPLLGPNTDNKRMHLGYWLRNAKKKNGGIDFNPSGMNMEVKNSGGEIRFHVDSAQLAQWRTAIGVTFKIINMTKLKNLPEFLNVP